MNLAHAHLILNHIPVLTIPMSLIFLVYALRVHNEGLKRFSLFVLILTSLSVLPAYLTGEPAEETIEHLPGVSEQLIEAHEEAAEVSLVVTVITGVVAVFVLLGAKFETAHRLAVKLLLVSCVVSIISLGYTANLGGQIRHPEIVTGKTNG